MCAKCVAIHDFRGMDIDSIQVIVRNALLTQNSTSFVLKSGHPSQPPIANHKCRTQYQVEVSSHTHLHTHTHTYLLQYCTNIGDGEGPGMSAVLKLIFVVSFAIQVKSQPSQQDARGFHRHLILDTESMFSTNFRVTCPHSCFHHLSSIRHTVVYCNYTPTCMRRG